MIHVSEEFQRQMKERTDFAAYAQVTLADGRELAFTAEDFTASGLTVTDGAGSSGLPLGEAMCRTVQMELVNADGRLEGYDFFGARIRLWLTFALTASEERVELGTFTVAEPETWGETVRITAADDMIRADRAYTPSLQGESTLGELFRDVCGQCGLAFSTSVFSNSDMTVTVPEQEYTCRQMLGYIALLAGGNARVDRGGLVRVLTYDRDREADHALTDWAALNTDTDDVVVTGVEAGTDGGTVLEGEEGYVLTVDDPLMAGRETEALRRLGGALIGLTLRRFEGSHVAYPLAECMDTVRLRDRRGRWYRSVITDVTFTCGACTALSNSAESVVRNGSRYVSAETRARQQAKKLVQQERTARQAVEEQLQKRLAESSGFYTTDVEQPDRSVIRYVHDKPTLDASMNVIKITAQAIGFSTDGGKSYPFGLTVDGKTVMGIIAAEGLYADWMETGVLQSKADENGKRKFRLDLDNGDLDAEFRSLTIAGKSVDQALSDAVTGVENQFYLSGSPTALSGGKWQSTQPVWEQGKYIWSRQYVTYGDGTNEYLPSETGVCITGNTGTNGTNGKDGAPGAPGKDGANGTDGIGIDTIVAEYYVSTSATALSGGSWSTNMPTVQSGKYIWTRQKITYSDGNVEYAGEYCMTKTVGDIAQQKVDAQTQSDIFNKLTNNGTLKGLYMKDGELYINASFLATGILQSADGESFFCNLGTGDLRMKANSLSIAGQTVEDIAQGKINDISIGGTNLFPDSAVERTTDRFLELPVRDILSSYVGEDICVSFDAKINAGGTVRELRMYPYQDSGISIQDTFTFTPGSSYRRYRFVTKAKDFGIVSPDYSTGSIGFYDNAGTNSYSIRNIKIELGNLPTDWSPAPTQDDVFSTLTNNGAIQGLFMRDGQLYINAQYLRGDTIDLNTLKLAGTVCGLMQGSGKTGDGATTTGIVLYGNGLNADGTAKPPYLIITSEGVRLQLSDEWPDEYVYLSNGYMQLVGEHFSTTGNINTSAGSYGIWGHPAIEFDGYNLTSFGSDVDLAGGLAPRTLLRGRGVYINEDEAGHDTYIRGENIYESQEPKRSSDARLKKNIEPLSSACARMLDHLTPVSYRYAREADDAPKHWGYTTQDVEAALRAVGLGRADMAALGEYEDEKGRRYMALAYGEIIAALHLKVKDLEDRIRKLEEKGI